jgi:cellulose synthase/poly-beta-1,6-N-acetylglucosamine synthase-like glycosyltransferase
LSSLSEIVEHRIYDSLRARLGWPERLRGTGMIFRRKTLEKYSAFLHTNVEDLELTLLIGEANVPIAYLPQIVVLDPKPQDPRGAMHQRARWLRGQFQVVRDYGAQILRLILRGPKGWSLLASALLKPRAFLIPLKIISVLFFLHMAFQGFGWLWVSMATFGCASVLIDLGTYLYGLRYTRFRWKTFVALAASPLYIYLWVQSTAMAFIHRQPWLSSRRPIPNPARQRTTQFP